jgi:hypothetical protein
VIIGFLLHALEGLKDRNRYRGIGIVDDRVSDKELERLPLPVYEAHEPISSAFLPSISARLR